MNTLAQILPATQTPAIEDKKLLKISFIEKKNFLSIKGWSVTPELKVVYAVLLEEIQDHLASNESITINFGYKIFNPFTAQFLFKAIKTLNQAKAQGKQVNVNWIAEKYNTEIYEMGMDLKELCEFDFNVNLKHHTISPSLN